MYSVKFSQMAEKDKNALKRAGLEKKAKELLNIIAQNPLQIPPYQKLVGALEGNCSMRINIQHRIVNILASFTAPVRSPGSTIPV